MSALPEMREATAADQPRIAADEAADVVAKAAVPFRPAVAGKIADLVQAGRVPGLGDDLGLLQRLGKLDAPDHRRMGHRHAVFAAGEDRALVETETVDVHLADPKLQALEDELLHHGWLQFIVLPQPE